MSLQAIVEASPAVDRRRRADRAIQLDDIAVIVQQPSHLRTGALAFLNKIRANKRAEELVGHIRVAIQHNQRDAGFFDLRENRVPAVFDHW